MKTFLLTVTLGVAFCTTLPAQLIEYSSSDKGNISLTFKHPSFADINTGFLSGIYDLNGTIRIGSSTTFMFGVPVSSYSVTSRYSGSDRNYTGVGNLNIGVGFAIDSTNTSRFSIRT